MYVCMYVFVHVCIPRTLLFCLCAISLFTLLEEINLATGSCNASVYVCIYVCIYVYMYVCIRRTLFKPQYHFDWPVWVHTYMHTYWPVWVHTYMYHTYMCIHTCTTHTCAYIHVPHLTEHSYSRTPLSTIAFLNRNAALTGFFPFWCMPSSSGYTRIVPPGWDTAMYMYVCMYVCMCAMYVCGYVCLHLRDLREPFSYKSTPGLERVQICDAYALRQYVPMRCGNTCPCVAAICV